MSRTLLKLLAISLLAFVAAPVVLGQLAYSSFNAFTDGFNQDADRTAVLETLAFERGYLRSTARSRLTLPDVSGEGFTIDHEISHNPFSIGSDLVVSRVSSRAWPADENERASLEAPVAESELIYSLKTNKVSIEFSAPAYAGKGAAAWTSISGSYEFDPATNLNRLSLEAKEIRLAGEDGVPMELARLSGSTRYDTSGDDPEFLQFDFQAEGVAIETPLSRQDIGALSVAIEQSEHGQLVDYAVAFDAKNVDVPTGSVDRFAFDLSFENLTPEVVQQVRDQGPQALESMSEIVSSLAEHGPKLVVRELNLAGDVAGQGRVDFEVSGQIGIDPKRYEAVAEIPNGFAHALDLRADISVNEGFIQSAFAAARDKLAAQGMAAPSVGQLQDTLLNAGLLVRDGSRFRTAIAMSGLNSIEFNDRPFNPAMLAGMMRPGRPATAPRSDASVPLPPERGAPVVSRSFSRAGSSNAELEEMRRQMGLH